MTIITKLENFELHVSRMYRRNQWELVPIFLTKVNITESVN